jgi:hypothetical protein
MKTTNDRKAVTGSETTHEARLSEREERVLRALVHVQESVKAFLWPRTYGPAAHFLSLEEALRRIREIRQAREKMNIGESDPNARGEHPRDTKDQVHFDLPSRLDIVRAFGTVKYSPEHPK